MSNLLKLAERVEAGKEQAESGMFLDYEISGILKTGRDMGGSPKPFLTSLDAAKALHDAVLPGWAYEITWMSIDFSVVKLWGLDTDMNLLPEGKGVAPSSAAAWVAAILRAKVQSGG